MSNRIRNFPTALKQFQSADPWAAPGFGTLCPGCMTRTTTSCGRTTEQRAKLATSKAGGDWELGWIQLRATKKNAGAERVGQKQAMEQMLAWLWFWFWNCLRCGCCGCSSWRNGWGGWIRARPNGPKNVLQYASSWKIHHKFHATTWEPNFSYAPQNAALHCPRPMSPVPSTHPSHHMPSHSIHPIQPIQTQSVLPTSVGDFYLYIRTPRYTYVVQHVAASRHAKVC